MYSFILNDIDTPWFPRVTMKFSKPSKTRHGIFCEEDEMEFDDSDTWPLSELLRLDNINVSDENILFAINTSVHPLEHASALAVKLDDQKGKHSRLFVGPEIPSSRPH